MTPILPENTVDFPRYYFGRQKCLENLIPKNRISCLCDLFIFNRMTPVIVKLLDITRLLNMILPKRNLSFLRYDTDQLTCGVNFN